MIRAFDVFLTNGQRVRIHTNTEARAREVAEERAARQGLALSVERVRPASR